MRLIKTSAMMVGLMFGLAGCVNLACLGGCPTHVRNSTSLVEFLYPHGSPPPAPGATPQLRLPLRVGLAFLPSTGSEGEMGLDAAHKEALLEEIRRRFVSRKFIADIVVIPDYYLRGAGGFAGLAGVERLYGVDLMALVSYDQVSHEDGNDWSLGYVTIVGAYILKGTRHDVSTLVDLAVVDPATRSLVLRAGGFDNRHGDVTLVREEVERRAAAHNGFDAATVQMIAHFDTALLQFEADVHEGRAPVQVVSGGTRGGMGSLGGLTLLGLVSLWLVCRRGVARRWTQHVGGRTMGIIDSHRRPG